MPITKTADKDPLIEVLPMNSEQRAAVQSALVSSHTVVTGPPGTGKSQVVTNLLVNAAWRGMKVLFASKNNKAVDVVEVRVNGWAIVRSCSSRLEGISSQARQLPYGHLVGQYVDGRRDQLSGRTGAWTNQEFARRLVQLDEVQASTLDARNVVDRLDEAAEDYRVLFGSERFNSLDDNLIPETDAAVVRYKLAADALDPSVQTLIGRFLCWLFRAPRLKSLREAATDLSPLALHLRIPMPGI